MMDERPSKLQYGLILGAFMTFMVMLLLSLAYSEFLEGKYLYGFLCVSMALILIFGSIFGVKLVSKDKSFFKD